MSSSFGVYQSKEYRASRVANDETIISLSPSFYALKKTIRLPFITLTTLEARGTPTPALLKEFKALSKDYTYGLIAPCVLDSPSSLFIQQGFTPVTNTTLLLDLTKGLEAIWQNLDRKSIRWGVGYAERQGLTFHRATQEDVIAFYTLYEQTALRGGFTPEKLAALMILASTEVSQLYVIKKKAMVVAGGLVLYDLSNHYAILDLTGTNEEGLSMQAMPFLYWKLIQEAHQHNLHFFDLGGFDAEARSSEKTASVNAFKQRFGGELKTQPFYATGKLYPFLRALLKHARFLKSWYHKH